MLRKLDIRYFSDQKFGSLRDPLSSSCGGLVAFGHQMGALRAPWTNKNTYIAQTQIIIHIQHKYKYIYGARTNMTTEDKFVMEQQQEQEQQYETYLDWVRYSPWLRKNSLGLRVDTICLIVLKIARWKWVFGKIHLSLTRS